MDELRHARLMVALTRLVQTARQADHDLQQYFAAWQVMNVNRSVRTHIHHDGRGVQHLEAFAAGHPLHLDELAAGLASVVHPLRVAHDRVEKHKVALGLGGDSTEWPPTDTIWAIVRRLDNLEKHNGGIPLRVWLTGGAVTVTLGMGGPVVGNLDARLKPRAFPVTTADAEDFGVSLFRIARIPNRYKGERHWYLAMLSLELHLTSAASVAADRSVEQVTREALQAGDRLIELVASRGPSR